MVRQNQRCATVLAAFLCLAASIEGKELTPELLFKPPDLDDLSLSPNGKYLAGFAWEGTNQFLVTFDLATRKRTIALGGDASGFGWVSDDRLIVFTGGEFEGGIIAVNRDGSAPKKLEESVEVQVQEQRRHLYFSELINRGNRGYPNVLIETLVFDRYLGRAPDSILRRVNVMTGKSEPAEKAVPNAVWWHLDRAGEPRLVGTIEKSRVKVLHRRNRSERWEAIIDFDIQEENQELQIFDFAADNKRLYVAARNGKDTLGLYLFDPEMKNLGECLWQNPRFDIDGIVLSGSGDLMAIVYEAERHEIEWLDPSRKAVYERIRKALPGMVVRPADRRPEAGIGLYFAYSDRVKGAYYLFNSDRNQLELLAEISPWLKPQELAETKPISYAARDGLEIHAYLTLPPEREAKNLPLIVLPHGGPWVRDTWGFDPEVQFLASRGYAVLQPNYRGSTGYGLKHIRAGYKQFGMKIQDDISDGLKWAVDQGIADPRRSCIYGSSFGGYAAMVGLTRTPELFRCGVNIAGPTDLRRQLRSRDKRWSRTGTHSRMAIGDYRNEKELLEEASPLNHIESIRAPVMLVYGGEDHIVDISQGRLLEKALKKHKKTFEFVFEKDEGHGFKKYENRVKLYKRIDAFLRKHME